MTTGMTNTVSSATDGHGHGLLECVGREVEVDAEHEEEHDDAEHLDGLCVRLNLVPVGQRRDAHPGPEGAHLRQAKERAHARRAQAVGKGPDEEHLVGLREDSEQAAQDEFVQEEEDEEHGRQFS